MATPQSNILPDERMKRNGRIHEEVLHIQESINEAERPFTLFRSSGFSNYDESGSNLIICPECEEWTWAKFNLHSGLLDLLGDLDVTTIDTDDGDIKVWVETKAFNYFLGDREEALMNS